jgi:hypothetical protein
VRPVGPFSAYEIGTMLVDDVYDLARRQFAPQHIDTLARAFEREASDAALVASFQSPLKDLDALGKLEEAC